MYNIYICKVVGDTCRYCGFTYITINKNTFTVQNFQILQYLTRKNKKKNWNGKNYKSPSKIRTHDLHIRT